MAYQPKTGAPCGCKRGIQRDNCPNCEGTGQVIDFAAIRARTQASRIKGDLMRQGVNVSTDCILTALRRGDSESEIKASMSAIWSDILERESA
jgi:hypothetical protein